MAGAITYDGVEGGEGGYIFDGIKFWVAQRVPMRAELLNHIKSNAGAVVPLEKDATYMIADHARKDAPTGSYSWKFITESVTNGIVQVPDRYRNAWTPDIKRPAGSGRPTKGTRTPFTNADDAQLAHWVLSHQIDRSGNKIFQEFEGLNDRHTWQSWRNRYIKKLMLLPNEQLEALAAQGANIQAHEQAAPPAIPAPVPVQRSTPHNTPTSKSRTAAGKQISARTQPAGSGHAEREDEDRERDADEEEDVRIVKEAEELDAIDRDGFYRDLSDFCIVSGRQFVPNYLVLEHEFGLWDLAKAVAVQKVPTEEVDWIEVAEDLAFPWEIAERAADALKHSYNTNLVDFLEMILSFQRAENDEMDLPEQESSSSGVSPSSPIVIPSSPPQRYLAQKRNRDVDEISIVSKKRRRLSKTAEVPSTPQKQASGDNGKRPRSRSRPSSREWSKDQSQITQVEDDGEVRFETQVPLPKLSLEESQVDVSPSQQLRSEWMGSSPLPKQSRKQTKPKKDGKSSSKEPGADASARMDSNGSSGNSRKTPQRPPTAARSVRAESELFVGSEPSPAKPSSRLSKSRKQKAGKAKSSEDEFGELVQHYESLGYSYKTVLESLQRTTMVPGLATVVMQSLKDGKGIPGQHEGIWTDRDDEGLRLMHTIDMDKEGSTSEERKAIRKAQRAASRLEEKHGQKRMQLRRDFLAAQKGSL